MNFISIKNYTPHKVVVYNENKKKVLEIEPSGEVVRITSQKKKIEELNGVPLFSISYGSPEGLPKYQEGVFLLVSGQVRTACPERTDLVSPGELIRDDQGRPIGCLGLNTNQKRGEIENE